MRVEQVSSRDVTTRFGPKKSYSFRCDDGKWYSTGFKAHGLNVGDNVTFDFEVDRYGNQVKMETLKIGGAGGAATPATPAASSAGRSFGPPTKPFPIPLTHGDRSIIRQNSITNAVKLVTESKHIDKLVSTMTLDDTIKTIVRVAREFEMYSAGDIERLEAEKTTGE